MDENLPPRKAMVGKKEMNRKKSKQKSSQPIKVVYISNPMKIEASASEFRALVQQFTGKYAKFPDPSMFPMTDDDLSGDREMVSLETKSRCDDYATYPVSVGDPVLDVLENSSSLYDVLGSDETGVWPSNLLYES